MNSSRDTKKRYREKDRERKIERRAKRERERGEQREVHIIFRIETWQYGERTKS